MTRPSTLLLLAASILATVSPAGAAPPADGWVGFVERAAEEHGAFGRRCAEFLAEHRHPQDADLDAAFLLENLRLALAARAEFPWSRAVPEEVFLNDVLPYAVLDETRDPWRSDFRKIARELVAACKTPSEAAQTLNRLFFDKIDVHYDTGRKKPNQSPRESIAQGRATCTGLSIVLVDACRSVGVPARVAGTALWADKRGNHTWVEIWDGKWSFTGADEFDPKGLDRGWFAGSAAQAVADDWRHAIWATSWKRTGSHFPMVWNLENENVPAINVTARYTAGRKAEATAVATVGLRIFERTGGPRLVVRADLLDASGKLLQSVETKAGRADMNDMAQFTLAPERDYLLRLRHGGEERTAALRVDASGAATRDLVWGSLETGSAALGLVDSWLSLLPEERHLSIPEVALTEAEAAEVVKRVAAARRAEPGFEPEDDLATPPPWPAKIVWRREGQAPRHHLWLAVTDDPAEAGETIRAEVSAQTIALEVAGRTSITLRLHDALLDLDREISVTVNGELVFEGVVERTVAAVHRSLLESADPATAATALLQLAW